jgi:ribose transport system substrate-binding protein
MYLREGLRRWRVAPVLALTVGAMALAVGCGSSSDNSSTGATGPATTAGAATTAASGGEKTIGYVDVLGTAAIEKRFYNAVKYGADELGWKTSFIDAKGDQGAVQTAVRTLVGEGVDGIILSSVPSEWVQPVKQLAESKKIPLINLITQADQPGVYTSDIDENTQTVTKALAAYVKQQNPDGAKVGFLYTPNAAIKERFKVFKESVAGSNVQVVASHEQALTDSGGVKKSVVDMINGNPDISTIVVGNQDGVPGVLAGLRSIGSKVPVYGFYADSAISALMKTNPQLAGVVDSDSSKVSFIALDQLRNYFAGKPITPAQQDPPIDASIVTAKDVQPFMLEEQGPVPYTEVAKPYFEEWKTQ